MAEDLIPILTRFHREVVLPDIQRVVGELRLEMNERFAALDKRRAEEAKRGNRRGGENRA